MRMSGRKISAADCQVSSAMKAFVSTDVYKFCVFATSQIITNEIFFYISYQFCTGFSKFKAFFMYFPKGIQLEKLVEDSYVHREAQACRCAIYSLSLG